MVIWYKFVPELFMCLRAMMREHSMPGPVMQTKGERCTYSSSTSRPNDPRVIHCCKKEHRLKLRLTVVYWDAKAKTSMGSRESRSATWHSAETETNWAPFDLAEAESAHVPSTATLKTNSKANRVSTSSDPLGRGSGTTVFVNALPLIGNRLSD